MIRSSIVVFFLGLSACDEEPEDFQSALVVAPIHLGDDLVVGWSPPLPSTPEHVSSFELSSADVLVPDDGRPPPFLVLLVRLGPSADVVVSVNDEPVAELMPGNRALDLGEAVVEIIDAVAQGLACGVLNGLGGTPRPYDDPENDDYFRETPSLQSHAPVFLAVPWGLLKAGRNEVRFELAHSAPGDTTDEAIVGYAAISSIVDGCALYFDMSPRE